MNDCDLAWAAGLFEGEGFIVRRKVGKRVYIETGLQTCDLDVLERFVAVVRNYGISPEERPDGPRSKSSITRRKRRAAHHKVAWSWKTTGNTGIALFLLLRPHLGERRRSKGDEIIREGQQILEALRSPVPCEECGRLFVRGNYATNKRFCSKPCHGRWKRRQPGEREKNAARQARYYAKPEAREKRRLRNAEYEKRRKPRRRSGGVIRGTQPEQAVSS